MPNLIDHIDGESRRIHLAIGNTALTDILAFYREYRALRRIDALQQYAPFLSVIGGQYKGSGRYVGRTIDLHDALIVPANASHRLLLTFEIIDSGQGISGRDVFDRLPLTPGITVDIDIQIAPVEIIMIGSGGLTQTEHDALLLIRDIEEGDWMLDPVTNQLILKKKDHSTVLAQFDLKNKVGVPSTDAVYSRRTSG